MSRNNSTINENGNTAISLFTPISAPILRSVDPAEMAKLLKERERYELEVKSKQSEIPSLKVLPYKASTDHQLRNDLVFTRICDELASDTEAKNLTDGHIEQFAKYIIEKEGVICNYTVLEKALKFLRRRMNINNADVRITQFCCEFFNRLNAVGYEKFRKENPKQTVKLTMKYVYPTKSKEKMQKYTDLNKPIRKNVKNFIAQLSIEATNCQPCRVIKQTKNPNPK